MSAQPSSHDASSHPVIPEGTVVGGRFRVERVARDDTLGAHLFARDEKTQKPIAIRTLSPAFVGREDVFDLVRAEIKHIAKLKHRALVGVYGVGMHEGQTHFIACEWVQGTSLAEFLDKRREAGKPLSLRGSYNIIAHLAKALGKVHELTCHGAVGPRSVWITRAGRVKLSDCGLGVALAVSGEWRQLPLDDQAFLAPEIRAGGRPDVRSDIWSLGALLYAMLTGRTPANDRIAPSQVHPDAGNELDAIVARCMATDATERFQNTRALTDALLPLVAEAPEPESNEFGINLEVDVDIAMSLAPPVTVPPSRLDIGDGVAVSLAPPVTAPPAAPGEDPSAFIKALAQTRSAANPFATAPQGTRRVSPGSSPGGGGTPFAPRPAPAAPPPPEIELGEIVADLTKDDAPRWMAVKNGLDHGPFTMRELIKLVVEGEILEEHDVLNMDTRERKPLQEYEEFKEFVGQYKLRKAEKDHAVALEKSTKVEKRGNVAKLLLVSGAIGLVVAGAAGYLLSREAAKRKERQAEVDLAALFETGQVKITGTADILKAPPRRTGSGAKRKGDGPGAGPGPGGFASYDDAMNRIVEMDMSKAGGERQLRSSDVAGVMNRKLNSLFGCVGQELRRGGRLSTVRIDLAIAGSGQVMGASVNTGSAAFQQCIAGKVRSIQFPSFPAPRMGARYSFNVD